MTDGGTKPIEQIEEGDWVLAYDPETGERGARRVSALIEGEGVKELVAINLDGVTLTATDLHPFWVDSLGTWISAEDLRLGDELLTATGRTPDVDGLIHYTLTTQTVYNLTVEGLHTFYVLAGDHAVLVHNAKSNGDCHGEEDSPNNPVGTSPTYEPNPKHGSTARGTAKGTSSPAPTNGQLALDNSVQVKPTSTRRVGVDPTTKEIVVFDEHLPYRFHGHVRSWDDLHPDMQKALINAGQVTKKGKVK